MSCTAALNMKGQPQHHHRVCRSCRVVFFVVGISQKLRKAERRRTLTFRRTIHSIFFVFGGVRRSRA